MNSLFLTFSDSAKFAQAAKNVVEGNGFNITHSFFDVKILENFQSGQVFPAKFMPAVSWVLSAVFKFFQANDTTIAITGIITLLLSSVLIFSIGTKLKSKLTGLMALVFFLSHYFFWDYSFNFSTEILFILEMLIFARLVISNTRWKYLSLIPLPLMFFTRDQAPIFWGAIIISGLISFLFYSKKSKAIKLMVVSGTILAFLTFAWYGLVYPGSVLSPARLSGSINLTPESFSGAYLRGAYQPKITLQKLISKVFYNLYNFAKSPERIIQPIILFLFTIGLFIKSKDKKLKIFNLTSLTSVILFILAASATLPNARYVHPVVPLLCIGAAVSLHFLLDQVCLKLRPLFISLLSILILIPVLGHFTIDQRFRSETYNLDKEPVYKTISSVMAENVPQGELVLTNLDAWAAWYEGLTTMWFPVSPDVIDINVADNIPFIVITNYKEKDGSFLLGDWDQVVYRPENISNPFLKKHYNVLKTFEISADSVYENQTFRGTILINKEYK